MLCLVSWRDCSVLQCVAVCCSVLQYAAVCCSVLQRVAACCSVLQCVAVCCSVLQAVLGNLARIVLSHRSREGERQRKRTRAQERETETETEIRIHTDCLGDLARFLFLRIYCEREWVSAQKRARARSLSFSPTCTYLSAHSNHKRTLSLALTNMSMLFA